MLANAPVLMGATPCAVLHRERSALFGSLRLLRRMPGPVVAVHNTPVQTQADAGVYDYRGFRAHVVHVGLWACSGFKGGR